VAADAGADVDDRVRIRQALRVEEGLRFARFFSLLGGRRGLLHFPDHAPAAAPRVGEDQREPDEKDENEKADPACRRRRAVIELQLAGEARAREKKAGPDRAQFHAATDQ
jgi:hypothetical protein